MRVERRVAAGVPSPQRDGVPVVARDGGDPVAARVERDADDGTRASGVTQHRERGLTRARVQGPNHRRRLQTHLAARRDARALVHRQTPNVVRVAAEVPLRRRFRVRTTRRHASFRRDEVGVVFVFVFVNPQRLHDAHARGEKHALLARFALQQKRALVHLRPALGRLRGDARGDAVNGDARGAVH